MQRTVVAEELLKIGRVHRHRADCQIAYDPNRQLPTTHLVAAVQRYDRQLFFRYNVVSCRWELWRFRDGSPVTDPKTLSPEEMVSRAVYVKTVQTFWGAYADPDWRILEYLHAVDEYRKGRESAERTADHLDRQSAAHIRKKREELHQEVDDWKRDNREQIRSLRGLNRYISVPR